MKTHEFTIVARGLSLDEKAADRFFEAGCDDATVSIQKGVIILEFDREAKSFFHALRSAIENVEAAGAEVVHIEPDHLVSLSDIANRAGITRAAVSNYAKGSRGKDFPAPVARVTTESPLWDWVEVARWLHRNGSLGLTDIIRARIVRFENGRIQRHSNDRLARRIFKARPLKGPPAFATIVDRARKGYSTTISYLAK
jgi:hypothetical protein